MTLRPQLPSPPDAEMLRRVRWRLVAWSAGLTMLVMLGLGTAVYLVIHASLTGSAVDALELRLNAVEARLTSLPPERFPRRPELGFPDVGIPFGAPGFGGSASGTVTLVVDSSGRLFGPLQSGLEGLPIAAGIQAAQARGEDLRESSLNATPVRVLSRRITVNNQPFVIQIVQDRAAEERTLALLVAVLGAGAAAAVALAIGLGFVYAGRALVPIRASLRHQRDFAADASHELRTPLTVIGLNVSELRRDRERPLAEVADVVDDIDAEVGQLTTLVEELLLLARSDSGAIEVRREAIDLSEVVAEALPRLDDLAAARTVTISLDAVPALMHGDRDRLAQLVTILADNAIRFSPPGGMVHVTVGPSDGRALLVIEDQGPGIRAEDLPRLFDRFWRAADAPPGGVGLGLSIAAWIVRQHRGQINAADRPGGGARFVVSVPLD
jgi:two-component system, OmpR family, sensor histidine kinase CiaH